MRPAALLGMPAAWLKRRRRSLSHLLGRRRAGLQRPFCPLGVVLADVDPPTSAGKSVDVFAADHPIIVLPHAIRKPVLFVAADPDGAVVVDQIDVVVRVGVVPDVFMRGLKLLCYCAPRGFDPRARHVLDHHGGKEQQGDGAQDRQQRMPAGEDVPLSLPQWWWLGDHGPVLC